jgi:hypothetical protein
MDIAYINAARRAREDEGSTEDVPIFCHFVGTEDAVVSAPRILTEFDRYEGAVEGGHSTLKLGQSVSSVLTNRIVQLIQDALLRSVDSQREKIIAVKQMTVTRERATMAQQATRAGRANANHQVGRNFILISCSRTKSDAPGRERPKAQGIEEQLSDPRVMRFVIEMRSRILRLIQEGRIDGVEFKQGNRASMPVNRRLLYGPEFGGVINEARYLPAYERYTGRCFQAQKDEWQRFYEGENHPELLIMSGLYGLVPPTEFIQDYDVHLTDVDLDSGISLQTYWKDRELMTQILISHLEWIERTKGPVGMVIDLLSELSYQETINWALVDRRWPVLHRVFEKTAGVDALGHMGVWLRDVLRDPHAIQTIEKDAFYDNPGFHPADRIAFEEGIGQSQLKVSRELGA